MKTLCSFFLLTLLTAFNLQAGTLSATPDRNQLGSNETLTLSIQYDSSTDEEPDTRELEQQFAILSRNTSSNIQIINGDISRKTIWYYELAPRKSGTLLIPGFTINGDTSEAIAIEVSATSNNSASQTSGQNDPRQNELNIYTETVLDKERIFIQQQAVITWRLVYRRNINEPQFPTPQIDGVLVQDLGMRSYKRTGADGKAEGVIEQRYALFPQKSGNIVIPAQQFQVTVETMRRTAMGLLRTGSNPVPFDTDEKSLEVIPAVNNANSSKNTNWLPASSLEISQEILDNDSGQATVGTAFTRVIRMRAEGLSAEQLPPPDMQADGIKVYSEKPELSNKNNQQGVIGMREDRAAIIATQAGKLVLPAISIPWYDVNKNQWQEAVLPEKTIDVLPGAASNSTNNASANITNSNDNNSAREVTPQDTALPSATTNTASIWQIITAVLCALLLAVLIYIHQLRKNIYQPNVKNTASDSSPAAPPHFAVLRQAAENGDAKKLHQALLIWANEKPAHSEALQHSTILPLLQSLEKHLYGNGTAPDMAALKNLPAQLEKLIAAPDKNPDKKPQLDTLYR